MVNDKRTTEMIAYFDCFSGISGDMTLGALVDAGLPIEKLRNELARLSVKGYVLDVKRVKRAGFKATKVDVLINSKNQDSKFKKWKDIEKIVAASTLSKEIKQKGLSVFRRLFEAEARVHGGRYDRIHLHELGAVDCIVDIFGTLIGLDILGIDKVYASKINVGSGNIMTEHGLLPVPSPASVELLKGIPVYSSDVSFELTTPTGAVLISSLASGFGPLPDMQIKKTGIGAGTKNFKKQPNILRLLIGQKAETAKETNDEVDVIETNIDDMNPQVYEYVMERLFKTGALDVFLTQIIMKKGRPGIKLTVLCSQDKKAALMDIIFKETTSIGLRFYRTGRRVLKRQIKTVETEFGKINLKLSEVDKKSNKMSVEYEDCRKIAKKYSIPLLDVIKMIGSRKK